MRSVILASASPRRKKLFELMNIPVTICPSAVEETVDENVPPEKMVCILAAQKGTDIASGYDDAIIISADTIVVHQNKILGKPQNKADAVKMLTLLSGDDHFVYSGVCIIDKKRTGTHNNRVLFFERTKVTFSSLDELEIEEYINTGNPMDKAGAYGIQDDIGSLFVKKIDGDYYNVVGFPVNAFYQILKCDYPTLFRQIFTK